MDLRTAWELVAAMKNGAVHCLNCSARDSGEARPETLVLPPSTEESPVFGWKRGGRSVGREVGGDVGEKKGHASRDARTETSRPPPKSCLCILLVRPYFLLVHTTCSCILLVRGYYLFVHTTCSCILLVRAYYLFVHTTCFCILLASACYFFVHTTFACILLFRAYYLSVHTTCVCILLVCAYYLFVHGRHFASLTPARAAACLCRPQPPPLYRLCLPALRPRIA